MDVVRDHDCLYLKEDRKHTPKEYFKFLGDHTLEFLKGFDKPRILDIGCATGDFLWYISKLHPNAELTGIDVMLELLQRASIEVPEAHLINGDIYSGSGLPEKKFDAVFMLGVHTIFDEYRPWIDNALNLTDVGGRVYIFSMFNPEDVDVLVKARYSGESGPWQAGWNMFSKKTIGLYLESLGLTYKFTDWGIPIDLERHEDDPLRSWTLRLANGGRVLVNGTQILHHMSLLEIEPVPVRPEVSS